MTSTAFKAGTRRTKKAAHKAAARPAFSTTYHPVFAWLSVAEAASLLRLSQTTVRAKAKSGEFVSRKANGRTEVSVQTA